jgi:hypothetical protein
VVDGFYKFGQPNKLKMKILLTLLFVTIAAITCKGQVSEGSTMSATIDGKPWKARSVYSPAIVNKVLGIYQECTITLPYYAQWKAGDKATFSERYQVLFEPPAGGGIWFGNTGHMEITRVSGEWMDGTFSFTATMSGSVKKIEVTNGVFHINMKKPQ